MAEPGGTSLPPAIGCPLLILYGSETGTAQEAAERISREARARHWLPRVLPCDSPEVITLLPRCGRAVFSVATAGQGEFPPNARSLWKFLARASLPSDCLSGLKIAVFGFGDSGYPLFNAAARKLYRRLVEGLGAAPLVPLGLGDDNAGAARGGGCGGPDAALDPWLRELWRALRGTTAPLPPGMPPEEEASGSVAGSVETLGPCRFSVEVVERTAPPSLSLDDEGILPSREEALEAHAAFARLDAASAGEASAPPGYEVKTSTSTLTSTTTANNNSSGPAFPLSAIVTENKRLTPESHWQDTRHLSLRITSGTGEEVSTSSSSSSSLYYSPGDVAAFLPEQSRSSVSLVLSSSGLSPRDKVRVSAVAADSPLMSSSPPPASCLSFETSAAALVAGVLELDGASPRRRLFEVLAAFCGKTVAEDDEKEATTKTTPSSAVPASLATERLSHFASSEGRLDLDLYCRSESRTLSEVLSDFQAAARATPLAWLLSAAPRLRPRRFSIASDPSCSPSVLELAVAVVDYRSPHGRHKVGLASGWLSGLEKEGGQNRTLPLWIERGALSLPSLAAAAARQQAWRKSPSSPLEAWLGTPLILIGPGTGIAPMRSFLQFRREELRKRKTGNAVAPCSLYFGCRSSSADCYYRTEFEAMVSDGTLERYRVASSREVEEDGVTKKPRRYVTHLLREDAVALWRLLCPPSSDSSPSPLPALPPATVIVAGSAKNMPRDVQLAFEDIASEQGGLSKEEAKALVRKMVAGQRYFVEAWA